MRRVLAYEWILVCLFAVMFLSGRAWGSPIVGIGNGGALGASGILYSINPITGSVTAVGFVGSGPGSPAVPISPGPEAGTYFIFTGINHYLVSYPPGVKSQLWDSPTVYFYDMAYDSSNGTIFAMTTGTVQNKPAYLVTVQENGSIPGVPGSVELVPGRLVSQSPAFSTATMIEYIQGLGFYATDGHSEFLVDETTGSLTALPALFYPGPTITSVAYDPDSGRLIGVAGSFTNPTISWIYSIDPLTGQVTVLNSDAPAMYGISAVTTPEPSGTTLIGLGLICLLGVFGWRKGSLMLTRRS